MEFSKFYLAAMPNESQYKGSTRNILMNSVAKVSGYKLNQTQGVMDRATNALVTSDPDQAGGKANPSPPIGPALGQRGLNIMEFCKAFNAQTQGVEPGLPIPVVITAYADKSFTFVMKTPPASVLIKKAAKIDKGSAKPHTDKVGKLTRAQVEEIAKAKMKDLTAADLEAAMRTVAGSARSMGVIVEGM